MRPKGPCLVHVVTQKGKGYAPAEAAPTNITACQSSTSITGEQAKAAAGPPAYQNVFGEDAWRSLPNTIPHRRHHRRHAQSAPGSTNSPPAHPSARFDVGIAEQHGVTFAAGLAAQGMRPFCAIYSTFLQRAYDQVVHDVAIQNLPVRFAIDRAGLVGADGATHAGSFDITYLATLPNFVVMAPADEAELVHMTAHRCAAMTAARLRCAIRAATAPGWRCQQCRRRWKSARAGSCAGTKTAARWRSCRSARGWPKR